MARNLIVYFSRNGNNYVSGSIKKLTVGNTEVVAKMIKELVDGDLFQIVPVIEYDEDYNICIEEAKQDLQNNARPAFKDGQVNLDGYDTIYLGYPNYWGTMPMHVFAFLESYDFSGKIIKPFCTHEGSGMGSSERDIKNLCPQAKVEKGLPVQGGSVGSAKKLIEKWV